MEKLAFALIIAAYKLKPYFQAHIIAIQTDKPLWKTMNHLEAAERLALWVIELSEFDIQYRPRTAIKGQALANFVVEFMTNIDGDSGALLWKVHTDESLNRRASGIGVVTESPKGDLIKCDLPLIPNNQQ